MLLKIMYFTTCIYVPMKIIAILQCSRRIFIVKKMTERLGFRVVPVHPGLVTSDYNVHEVGVTICGVQRILCVLGVRIRPGTCHFPCNENLTRALNTTSLKCCLPSTDAIVKREKITHAYEGSRSLHESALH